MVGNECSSFLMGAARPSMLSLSTFSTASTIPVCSRWSSCSATLAHGRQTRWEGNARLAAQRKLGHKGLRGYGHACEPALNASAIFFDVASGLRSE